MPDQPQVSELLLRWEELREQGQTLSAEHLCAEWPQLAPELARQIAALQAVYGVLDVRDPPAEPAQAAPAGRPGFATTAKFSDVVPGRTHTAAPGADPAAVPPPVVPGYEVLEEVGRGGVGVVYKARQLKLNRAVALKMLLAGVHSGKEQLARFRAEAEAVARLQHPNIVHIYEVGEHQRRPFCALEFVEGGSLDHRLVGEPLPARQAAALAQTLARAMEAAHRAGIIHRDLKPGNVLLVGGPEVPLERCLPKITDFGLAKQLDDDSWKTRSGAIMGTPSYMAPEQAGAGVDGTGAWTDVYALGAMLYEFLTGRPPFRAASMMDTLDQVRHEEPVPPSRLQPRVPRDLETICLKCLQKEPRKRYASAQALADDLERFLQDKPILARPTGGIERLVKWARRRPAVAALILVSGMALLSMIVGALVHVQTQNRLLATELDDQRHLVEVEGKVRTLLATADELMTQKLWNEARVKLTSAQSAAEAGPGLEQLRAEIQPLLEQVDKQLQDQDTQHKQVEEANQRYDRFRKYRDNALLHASMSVGEDLTRHLHETEASAKAALALFDVKEDGTSGPRIPEILDRAQQAKVHEGCYEMLLALADAVAHPRLGQGPEDVRAAAVRALRVIDQAEQFIPKTKAVRLRRAAYYAQAGRRAAADAALQAADRTAPELAVDYYFLGEQQYKQGDTRSASKSFRQAFDRDTSSFWAQYLLAVCYVRQGQAEAAKQLLNACCRDHRDLVWPHLMLGFVNSQLDDVRAAKAAFETAEELARRDNDKEALCALYANRGIMLIKQRKVEAGIAELHRAIKERKQYQVYLSLAIVREQQRDPDAARAAFDEAINLEPDFVLLYRLRGRFHMRRNELQEALWAFNKAIELDTPNGAAAAADLARDHASCGRILHALGQYKQAVNAYEQARRHQEGYADPYLWRGEALLELKQYQAAADSVGEYIKRSPRPIASAYRARARAWTKLGRFPKAVHDYACAIGLQPNDAALHAARGWVCLALPDPPLALHDFDNALELQREPTAVNAARAWAHLTWAHLVRQSPLLALSEFPEAARINAARRDAYLGRALARVMTGESCQSGITDAYTALRLGPHTAEVCYSAARVFALAGSAGQLNRVRADRNRLAGYRSQAVALLRQAVDLTPAPRAAAFWCERAQRDPAFESIRGDPGFIQLVRFTRLAGRGRATPSRFPEIHP
jgi:tetratricopeptide (TPR) repeat protein/tRNA A-37 threonylcarbamoyl transferase component Bud32